MEEISIEEVAMLYEAIADELEIAARHCEAAAQRFRQQEVPRGSSHGFAVHGHLQCAQKILNKVAEIHASNSHI
ncbi:hypothetical protein [Candidatus Uabimicrobium sp. HlEnr_7]|uniref:hypothetical protein n=1 Tax=Candidatus Uabimicrobium helgolandensis TaxID=3095367 RepID=UPI0035569FB8